MLLPFLPLFEHFFLHAHNIVLRGQRPRLQADAAATEHVPHVVFRGQGALLPAPTSSSGAKDFECTQTQLHSSAYFTSFSTPRTSTTYSLLDLVCKLDKLNPALNPSTAGIVSV